eukprot:scaffold61598_cov63-Phaeocystis_antarctica.AAC.2
MQITNRPTTIPNIVFTPAAPETAPAARGTTTASRQRSDHTAAAIRRLVLKLHRIQRAASYSGCSSKLGAPRCHACMAEACLRSSRSFLGRFVEEGR